jgi:hypothetical protein
MIIRTDKMPRPYHLREHSLQPRCSSAQGV